MIDYKIVSASSPEGLTSLVNKYTQEGWTPVGSHQVVVNHIQNRFRGTQHVDSVSSTEYSQTLIKN